MSSVAVGRFASLTLAGLIADRVLGLVLALLISAAFGTSAELDAYLLAVAAPAVLATLLGDVIYSQLLPELSHGHERRTIVMSALLVLFGLTVLYALLWTAAMELVMPIDRRMLFEVLGVALAPLVLLGGLADLGATILVAEHRYVLAALRFPIATGVTVVVFALVRMSAVGIYGLAIATVAGALAATIVTAPPWWRHAQAGRDTSSEELFDFMRRIARAATAQLMAGAAAQASTLIERFIGIGVGPGVVSALNYGRVLNSPPLFVAQSVATAAYPRFVEGARQDDVARRRWLSDTTALVVFMLLPLATLLLVLADPLVRIVYLRGSFSPESAAATTTTTQILAVGIVPIAVSALSARFLYAEGRSSVVARVSVVSLLGYVILAVALRDIGYTGLAAASTAANILLFIGFILALSTADRRRWRSIRTDIVRTLAPSVGLAGVAALMPRLLPSETTTVAMLLVQGTCGIVTFVAVAAVLRTPELGRTLVAIRRLRASRRHQPPTRRASM